MPPVLPARLETLGPLLLSSVVALLQTTLPMRTIERGLNSRIDDRAEMVVRTAEDWTRLWTRHAGERARPPVDFGHEIVVAVFLGGRPTGGFNVEIVGAREDGDALVVEYRETHPPPDAVAAQVLTSPYHIAAVASHANVRFEKKG